MNSIVTEEQYLHLIQRFLARQMRPEAFCAEFTALWTQDRDAWLAQKDTWPEPYDEQLEAALKLGEITPEQFSQRWVALWGYASRIDLQEMVDRMHSACDCFEREPELAWEIDEEQLRREVTEMLATYQSRR